MEINIDEIANGYLVTSNNSIAKYCKDKADVISEITRLIDVKIPNDESD